MAKRTTTTRNEEPSVSGGGQFRVGPELLTGLVATATRGPVAVQYMEVDGRPLVEGDIVLDLVPPESLEEALQEMAPDGVIIPGAQFRWANGVVPYERSHPQTHSSLTYAAAVKSWRAVQLVEVLD